MGAGLRITTVILLFLVLYILFGVIYNLLAGSDFLEEVSSNIKNSLMLVISWPSFIFLLGRDEGAIGTFIASTVVFAMIIILFWVAHLIEKLLFPRNHIEEETEAGEYPTRNNTRKGGNSNNINQKERK